MIVAGKTEELREVLKQRFHHELGLRMAEAAESGLPVRADPQAWRPAIS